MREFYLIRHGQTTGNAEHRLQGHTDTHLNETGRDQARFAGGVLKDRGITPDLVIVSPLDRVQETAELATGRERSSFEVDPRIIEMGFGVLEMIRQDEMDPEISDAFHDHPDRYCPPEGGESFQDVIGRIRSFLDDMRRRPEAGTVLVVSHGAAIHAMIHCLNQDPLADFWKIHIGNCAVLKVTLAEKEGEGDSWTFLDPGFFPRHPRNK